MRIKKNIRDIQITENKLILTKKKKKNDIFYEV